MSILEDRQLTPQKAGKIAGKSAFLTRTVMGRVGRVAAKALYARQYSNASHMSRGLEGALWALLDIVLKARPRAVSLDIEKPRRPRVYADAFVKVRERRWKLAGSEEYETHFSGREPSAEGIEDNGYGVVVPIRRKMSTAILPWNSPERCSGGVRTRRKLHIHLGSIGPMHGIVGVLAIP